MTTPQPAALPEPTQEQLDAFIKRAGFPYGWMNLESSARRMAERAVSEIAALQPQPAAAVSDAEIDAVIRQQRLAGWFTFSDGPRAFARAILALRPQAVPMTPEQIVEAEQRSYVDGRRPVHTTDCWGDEKTEYEPTTYFNMFMFARAVEAHHGITAQGAQGEQG